MKVYQELDRLHSELIANVSHELRTPLGLIRLACTTLLREDIQISPDVSHDFLLEIEEETQKLDTIVGNLLELSRLENGRMRLECKPVDLGVLLYKVVRSYRSQLPPNMQFALEIPEAALTAEVDENRIEQVLRNLINNAIKYSPNGGTLTLRALQAGEDILLQVVDQGIGIHSKDLARVFDRFFRVEDDLGMRVGGVGLGLAVSKEIVEAHQGSIWVESAPGSGSTFTIRLTTKESQERAASQTER
jgi:two-component system sensor histidine kinase VicK